MIIRLEIRSYSSADVEVHYWQPESLDQVYFPLEIEIGEAGKEGADLFQVLIATPEGLRKFGQDDVISKRATLVVSDYSWKLVKQTIEDIVRKCEALSFVSSVDKLQRYFQWEYDDYS